MFCVDAKLQPLTGEIMAWRKGKTAKELETALSENRDQTKPAATKARICVLHITKGGWCLYICS